MTLPPNFQPRKWQLAAAIKFAACAAKPRERDAVAARAIVTAWMGSGKTELAFLIASSLGRRVLFVVNTDTLADQTEKRAKKAFPSMKVGLVKAAKNDTGADFVVASLQTLANPERLEALVHSETSVGVFDLVVVDECHGTFEGGTAARVLAAFPRRPALGLTATAWRLDRKDLAAVWKDGIIFKYGRKPAEADGVIVPICDGAGNRGQARRVLIPDIDVKAAIAAEKTGDKDAQKKAYGAAAWPVVAKEIAHMVGLGRRTVGFTPDVESSKTVADLTKQLGIKCEHLDGETPKREKNRILKEFAAGKIEAVTNCQILTVGFDDIGVGGVVWARATDSWSLFWQAVGRAIRSAEGKTDAMLTDLVGAYDEHGSDAAETLFMGEDSTEPTEAECEALAKAAEDPGDDRQTILWRGFLAALAGKRLLAGQRKNVAWLPVGRREDCYAYGGADGATYMIESVAPGLWCAIREPRGRCEPAVRLCAPQSLEGAQAAAERAARAGESFDSRAANWREKDANENVRAALAKWRVPLPDVVSAGEASDALVIAIAKAKRRDRGKRGILSGGGEAFE